MFRTNAVNKKEKKNISKRHGMKVNASVVKQPLYSGKVILSVGKHSKKVVVTNVKRQPFKTSRKHMDSLPEKKIK